VVPHIGTPKSPNACMRSGTKRVAPHARPLSLCPPKGATSASHTAVASCTHLPHFEWRLRLGRCLCIYGASVLVKVATKTRNVSNQGAITSLTAAAHDRGNASSFRPQHEKARISKHGLVRASVGNLLHPDRKTV